MLGSSPIVLVHEDELVAVDVVSGSGNSPCAESDWALERYGQKRTASESCTPAPAQVAFGTGLPLTGFSGTGGFGFAPGFAGSLQIAGPGVGSVTAPVRRPHQSSRASTGVALLAAVPSSV